MRNLKYCCIALFLAICVFSVRASASPLSANGNLTLTPFAETVQSYQLAKVYFLPDWSDKGMSFDGTDEKPCTEACPQKTSYDCASGQTETYTNSCGLTCSRCVECYGCEAKGYTLSDCPENASCLNDCCNNLYKLESCDSGYVLDGNSCRTETCSDNPNICTGDKTCVSGSCQCPNGQTEVSGKCETATCKNGGITCSGSAGVCNETTGQCVQCMTNSDCGGGKECNTTTNTCILPADPCENITCTNGTCSNGTCQCNAGFQELDATTCVECTLDSHCANGKICLNSSCVVDRDCQVGDIFYRDGVCSDIYDEKRELLAVVVDPSRRLLIFIGERPAPVSSSPSDASYQDVSTVSNEGIRDFFERGFINSRALANSGSRQTFCLNLGSDALMNEFYTPGGGEIFILSENAAKVEETLNFLKTKNSTATGIIGSTIFTSDEYADDPTKMIAATITKAGTNFWPSFKAVDKTDVTTMLRCFARYKCKSTDAAKCKITPYAVGDDPHTSYVKVASLPGKTGCTLEAFRWNTDYKRYIVLQNDANSRLCHLTGEGGGGGGTTEPTKTPCQPGDYLYATTTTEPAFCSASVVSSRTLLGRVLYTTGDGSGVILHHKMTADKTYRNNAGSLCSTYKLGVPTPPSGSWWLANIDDLRKNYYWESYISGSQSQYFWVRYTSTPYLFTLGGEGPLSPGSTDNYSGICTSSYSSTYRK